MGHCWPGDYDVAGCSGSDWDSFAVICMLAIVAWDSSFSQVGVEIGSEDFS